MTRARAGLLSLLTVFSACHSGRPEAQVAASGCAAPPPADSLAPSATAAGLPGEYRIHLTATAGPGGGRAADGTLRLWPLEDSLAREVVVLGVRDSTTSQPLAGSTDLDPATVGAVRTGDLGASDPAAPGVLVFERHPVSAGARAEIVLRLGSDANRRGIVRYDGGYFALRVRTLGAHGFTGTWASGSGPAAAAAMGYFCAARVESER